MEGHCSTGQSPQWTVVLMEEEVLFWVRAWLISTSVLCLGGPWIKPGEVDCP